MSTNTPVTIVNTAVGQLAALMMSPGATGFSNQAAVLVSQGTFVANGASAVTVANANLTANSMILVTLKTVGGTVGAIPVPQTVTPGTGFTIAGTASDTSTYSYLIIG